MATDQTLEHILRVARFARKEGYGVLSTGEKLGAALALNRADWLKEMDYTIGEAINRLEGAWITCIPEAARILRDEDEAHQSDNAVDPMPATATPAITLVATQRDPALEEDWYVHVDGINYGYLCRSDKPSGYAVGIGKPDGKIKYYSIENSKDDAIVFALKHLTLLLQPTRSKRHEHDDRND